MSNSSPSKKRVSNVPLNEWPSLVKTAFKAFFEEDSLFHGAALAYYTVFAMVPLLYLSTAVAGRMIGEETMLSIIRYILQSKVGITDVDSILVFVSSMNLTEGNVFIEWVSGIFLLIASTAVFQCLRSSMNSFYELNLNQLPKRRKLVKNIIFRLISILMIGGLTVAVIIIYFIQSFFIAWLDQYFGVQSFWDALFTSVFQHMSSIIGNAIVVLIVFKYVHDGVVNWRLAIWGALFTSILLYLGQLLINYYLLNFFFGAKGGGIAGSIFIILAWVYYSSQIIFFGAKFTAIYARWAKEPSTLKHK